MSLKIKLYSSRIFIILLLGCSPAPNNTDSGEPQPAQEILIVPPDEEIFRLPEEPLPGEIGTEYTLFNEQSILEPESDWEEYQVSVGDVVYHNGLFHMFYNGTANFGSQRDVGYAISIDGFEWLRVQDTPIFRANQINYVDVEHLSVSSVLIDEDGTWIMYFSVFPFEGSGNRTSIGRATATQPNGPWVAYEAAVLDPGINDDWDSNSVYYPSVVKTEDGYFMYYSGANVDRSGGSSGIGIATSDDGISWTKYDDPETISRKFQQSDPILKPEESSWDQGNLSSPRVLQTQDGWAMIYIGSPLREMGQVYTPIHIGLATSSDGIEWARYEHNPIFTPNEIFPEYFPGQFIWAYANNIYFLYLNMRIPMSTVETYLFTSEIGQ